jgi:NAD(P)-dependent dehydrogenase (short-subunit alcohol dehydrogenase family)
MAATNPAGWQADIDANLNGAFTCAHAVLPQMVKRRSGNIVNVGSVNGLAALGDPAYSAAKAGMISLTRSLAQEYGRYGIRANIVLPGTVRTPIWTERLAKEPEEVARVIAFLASDLASAVTGAAIPVDCGLTSGNIVMARELTLEDF